MKVAIAVATGGEPDAATLVKQVGAVVGGGGGGSAEAVAVAGGREPARLDDALDEAAPGPRPDMSAGPAGPGAKVLAVDLGSRRIGLAVSDAGGTIAFPWGKVERSEDVLVADRQAIASVVEEVAARTVVVGLPLSLDGGRGPAARAALDEARQLALVLGERGWPSRRSTSD